MHTGVCQIAYVARGAIIENSNGNNEGAFRHSKHDSMTYCVTKCKDPATYLEYYAMLNRSHATKCIDQLRNLKQKVKETKK